MKVIFGNMEFGEFKKGDDLYPVALVYDYFIKEIEDTEIEIFAWERGLEYVVPSEYKGEIYYCKGIQA